MKLKTHSLVFLGLLSVAGAASADFVVIDQQAKAGHALSAAPIIEGFGQGVSLGDLLQEITPDDWFISTDKSLLSQKVDWNGGVTWSNLIERLAVQYNWTVNTDQDKRIMLISAKQDTVKNAGALASDLPSEVKSIPSVAAAVSAESVEPVESVNKVANVAHITGKLSDQISINLRGKTLSQFLRVVVPQGWQVDTQVPAMMLETVIDYTGETTRGDALKEVLTPMGLNLLSYPNMSPSPLLVIVKGEK